MTLAFVKIPGPKVRKKNEVSERASERKEHETSLDVEGANCENISGQAPKVDDVWHKLTPRECVVVFPVSDKFLPSWLARVRHLLTELRSSHLVPHQLFNVLFVHEWKFDADALPAGH